MVLCNRVLVGCVSAHCEITGDGAKSFLLLLGALLRGIHGDSLRGTQVQSTARALLSFQSLVLDAVIGRSLAPHAPPLLLRGPAHLRALTDAYFRGKAPRSHWALLSQTACEFYQRWGCGPDGAGLALVSRLLPALLTAVPGLPVGRSRVLPGLLIHRDFAVLCPGPGGSDAPLRAVAASAALQAPLAPPGVTLSLASSAQVRRCLEAGGGAAERGVASLRGLGVGLLLSAAKQAEPALAVARRAGVSVLECVDPDELELFCRLTGARLFAGSDWSLIGEEHVATVTFCKPAVMGPDRLAHVGLPEGRGLAPHCLVLCGPSPGLTEQYTAAFCGLFRTLRRAFEPVQSHHLQPPDQSAHSQDPSITDYTHLSTDSTETGGPPHWIEGPQDKGEGPQGLIWDPSKGEGPLCADQSRNPLSTEPKVQREPQTFDWVQNGEAPGERPGVRFGKGEGEAWETGPAASGVLIEAGSVLPAGGAFEFLLHDHLMQRASRCARPDLRAVCRLVAGAALSVPRRLYPGRRFLQAQLRFLGPSGAAPPLLAGRLGGWSPWPVSISSSSTTAHAHEPAVRRPHPAHPRQPPGWTNRRRGRGQ